MALSISFMQKSSLYFRSRVRVTLADILFFENFGLQLQASGGGFSSVKKQV
jgi:hypothetical protein